MSEGQLLTTPGLVGAHVPDEGIAYLLILAGVFVLGLSYFVGCCSGAAAVFACTRTRRSSSPQGSLDSPVRRRQKQAEEGKKISPLREGFLAGPRARNHGAHGH